MKPTVFLTLLLWPFLGSLVLAHDAATLDRMPAPHGGQVRMAGPYHLELVLEPERMTVHVMDHANQSFPVEGGRARAVVSGAEGPETVELLLTSDDTLGIERDFSHAEGMTVEVILSIPGQKDWSVTFTPEGYAEAAAP